MKGVDRRSLLFSATSFIFIPQLVSAAPPNPPPHILLVCQFGTVQSPIARELLKRRAAQRHFQLEVAARGITPEQHITLDLLGRLTEDGINPAAEPLMKLSSQDVAAADLVISFDKLPPAYRPRELEDWSDLPSMVND